MNFQCFISFHPLSGGQSLLQLLVPSLFDLRERLAGCPRNVRRHACLACQIGSLTFRLSLPPPAWAFQRRGTQDPLPPSAWSLRLATSLHSCCEFNQFTSHHRGSICLARFGELQRESASCLGKLINMARPKGARRKLCTDFFPYLTSISPSYRGIDNFIY